MAEAARVKSLTDFTLGQATGPTIVYLDVSAGDEPSRRLHIEVEQACGGFEITHAH
jgi:hypothetical protein